jgi:hypothetical protein
MEPKLKPPRTNRSKLKCDILHSNFAFKFKMRRYTLDNCVVDSAGTLHGSVAAGPCIRSFPRQHIKPGCPW